MRFEADDSIRKKDEKHREIEVNRSCEEEINIILLPCIFCGRFKKKIMYTHLLLQQRWWVIPFKSSSSSSIQGQEDVIIIVLWHHHYPFDSTSSFKTKKKSYIFRINRLLLRSFYNSIFNRNFCLKISFIEDCVTILRSKYLLSFKLKWLPGNTTVIIICYDLLFSDRPSQQEIERSYTSNSGWRWNRGYKKCYSLKNKMITRVPLSFSPFSETTKTCKQQQHRTKKGFRQTFLLLCWLEGWKGSSFWWTGCN